MAGWLDGLSGLMKGGAEGVSNVLAVQQRKKEEKEREAQRGEEKRRFDANLKIQQGQLDSLTQNRLDQQAQKDEDAFQRLALNSAGKKVTPEQMEFIKKAPHLMSLVTQAPSVDKPGDANTPDVVEPGGYVFVEQIPPQVKATLLATEARERAANARAIAMAESVSQRTKLERDKMQLTRDIAEMRDGTQRAALQQRMVTLDAQIDMWNSRLALDAAEAQTARARGEASFGNGGTDSFGLLLGNMMNEGGAAAPLATPPTTKVNPYTKLPTIPTPQVSPRGTGAKKTGQGGASGGTLGGLDINAILANVEKARKSGGR